MSAAGAAAAAVTFALLASSLAACSSRARGEPGPTIRTVVLDIHHSRFRPSQLSVAPGTTVRFVVRNTDLIDHELIVGDQAVHDRHERGTEARHGAVPGEVSLAAGTTASTTYAFGPRGLVLFGCHLPGHWSYGMHGAVTVR